MSKKYGKVYGNDSQNQSDLDAGEGYPHPQLQARPQQNYPVNILEGPGYKLFEAQSQVSKWRKYVNIFGWICIVYGSLGVFLNLIALMFIDVKDFEVRGPKTVQEFDYPIGPQIVEKILDAIASLSTIF